MSYITDPSSSTVTLTGNSGGPVFSTGGNFYLLGSGFITVVGNPLTSTLTISGSAIVATSFTGDSGVATPALNVLKIIGGDNITTVASSNQVAISVSGLTTYAVQTGSGAGKLNSLAVGTNGQILVGTTTGQPVFATLGTTNGLNSTIGAGTLSIGGISASTSQIGVVLLASDPEAIAGTDTSKVIVPSSLKAKLGVQTKYALPIGADDAHAIGWLAVGANGETIMGSTGANCGWTSSPQFGGSVTALYDISSTSGDVVALNGHLHACNNAASAVAADIEFRKTRTSAIITSGDALGQLRYTGYDGVGFITGAKISSINSGTVGVNRIAGSLVFYTHPDSVIALPSEPLQRMSIAPTGEVTIAAPDSGTALTITAGGETITAGDLTVSSGNLVFPATTTTTGSIRLNSVNVLHTYGTNNIYLGGAGNVTNSQHSYNVGVGKKALQALNPPISPAGSFNVAVGYESMLLTTGATGCICLGYASGSAYTTNEMYNIIIGNTGIVGESNVIRIGGGTGSSAGQQNKAFVYGINGVTVSNTKVVTIDSSTSQLGTIDVPTGGIATLAGDSGTATGATVTIAGGSNITTSATSATVTVDLDNSITLTGDVTALNLKTSTVATNLTLNGNTITSGGSGTDVDINLVAKGIGGLTFDGISTGWSDSQLNIRQSQIQTADATETVLVTIPLVEGEMVTVTSTINGFQNDFTDALGGTCVITAYRPTGGNVTQIGEELLNINSTSTASLTAGVSVGTQSLTISVIGVAAETWNWVSCHQYMFTKTNA